MAVGLSIDSSDLKVFQKKLAKLKDQIPAATASAFNRTLDYTATQWSKLITQRYAIKPAEVKGSKGQGGAIKKRPATKDRLKASIDIRGYRLSFVHFPFNPKTPGTNRPVKVKIKKESGYKSIGTQHKPFVATTGAKSADKTQYNVFKRTTGKRKPIVVLRTLSIPQMASYQEISDKVQELASKKLEERIEHEIKYRLDKAAKAVKV